jgi:hypothetical protein
MKSTSQSARPLSTPLVPSLQFDREGRVQVTDPEIMQRLLPPRIQTLARLSPESDGQSLDMERPAALAPTKEMNVVCR